MPFSFNCGVFFNYSSRGNSKNARLSRRACGNIKNGDKLFIQKTIPKISNSEILNKYLNIERILIPIPRSSLLTKGALWPSKVICDIFFENGLCKEVQPIVERQLAVKKSSGYSKADDRVSCDEHYNSLIVKPSLIIPDKITLVDDVLTLGRTSMACARRLQEIYPNADIKIFTFARSMGLVADIDKVLDIREGMIDFNESHYSRKTSFTGDL